MPANLSVGAFRALFLNPSGRLDGRSQRVTGDMARKASESQIRQVLSQILFWGCFGWFIDAVLTRKPSGCVREPGRLKPSTVSLPPRDSGVRQSLRPR